MADSSKTVGSMCFGPYELSLDGEELRKGGNRLKLTGQAIQVLVVLANNAGKLVTREELQEKLWPGATYGDFEHGLNAAVNRLRETLGDSATDPKYIETIPRRGYRFIAALEPVVAPQPGPPREELKPPKPTWWKRKATIAAAACVVIAGTLYPWIKRPGDDRSEEHTSELQSPCNLVCRLLLEKKKKSRHNVYDTSSMCNSTLIRTVLT